jgi:hypothetical protein
VPSPGRLGAALAIPVAGILYVIGRDLYDGYRGRLKPSPPSARSRCRCPHPTLPTAPTGWRAPWMPPAGGPVVRDRRCPTNSVAMATAVSLASSIVYRQPAVIPLGWDHRVAGAPVPLHGVRLSDSDPSIGSLSSAPRRIELGTLGRPCGLGVHSRASEKPSLRVRRHAHSSLVLRCAVAIALKADGEVQARAAWLAPLVGADALGSQPGGLSDPAGPHRGAFASDDPFQDGPLGGSWNPSQLARASGSASSAAPRSSGSTSSWTAASPAGASRPAAVSRWMRCLFALDQRLPRFRGVTSSWERSASSASPSSATGTCATPTTACASTCRAPSSTGCWSPPCSGPSRP